MERRGREELIAQAAAAPAKSGRKGGVNTEREAMKIADAVAFTGYSRGLSKAAPCRAGAGLEAASISSGAN